MKQITFKILDTMARNLGNPLSISEITRNITKIHKHAYYKNVHDEIKNLQKQGIINISRTGNSSLLSLNTSYTGIIDTLAETETIRKRNLTEHYPNKAMLLDDIESEFRKGMYFTDSISLIESEKNFRLNRVELLFIQRTPNQDETEDFDEKKNILIKATDLGKRHGIRTDCLILNEEELISMLSTAESNPLKSALQDKIVFNSPQSFWATIIHAMLNGRQISLQEPKKPSAKDITHNLARFGYREIGWKIETANNICLESLITEILLKGNARMTEAVPVLLAKNKPSYPLLIFLCKKHGTLGKLLGLMSAMNKVKKTDTLEKHINLIKNVLEEKEQKADEKSIKQKMELYNAN